MAQPVLNPRESQQQLRGSAMRLPKTELYCRAHEIPQNVFAKSECILTRTIQAMTATMISGITQRISKLIVRCGAHSVHVPPALPKPSLQRRNKHIKYNKKHIKCNNKHIKYNNSNTKIQQHTMRNLAKRWRHK